MFYRSSLLAALTVAGVARAADNSSICDKYTVALFKDNTAENQYKLVSAVVNRAAVGNTTSNPVVAGIVTPGEINGQQVNLAPYFSGALNSTNRGGDMGVSVSFLDGGAAQPLMDGSPANGTDSNQYKLFTHLYSYFGALLGCSQYGKDGYPAYNGSASQYEVHKYMGLDENEVSYFIKQVADSASSFGVTADDLTTVGDSLNSVFNVKCAKPAVVAKNQDQAEKQSICIADSCPLAKDSDCSLYPTVAMPANVTMGGNGTSSGNSSDSSPTGTSGGMSGESGTASGSAGSPSSTGAASHVQGALGAVFGAVAIALAL